RDISRDVFRFAYAGDVNSPAARLDPRDQIGGAFEVVFIADLRAELDEFFDGDVEKDRNGVLVWRGRRGGRGAFLSFKLSHGEWGAAGEGENARPAGYKAGRRAGQFPTNPPGRGGHLQPVCS